MVFRRFTALAAFCAMLPLAGAWAGHAQTTMAPQQPATQSSMPADNTMTGSTAGSMARKSTESTMSRKPMTSGTMTHQSMQSGSMMKKSGTMKKEMAPHSAMAPANAPN